MPGKAGLFMCSACLFFKKKKLELFRHGTWFAASLPKMAFVCLPGFTPDINSSGPMGLISSDGCTNRDLAISYPGVGAEEDTDNYPRFLIRWQAMRLVSTPC